MRDQRARQGHALTLAARQFGRAMVGSLGQADRRQHLLGLQGCCVTRQAPNPQGHGHIVQSTELWQQVMELVNKADVLVAQVAQGLGAQARQGLAHDMHLTLRGRIQTAQQMQQGAFARARGAHNGDCLASLHRQVYRLQNADIQGALFEAAHQALRL